MTALNTLTKRLKSPKEFSDLAKLAMEFHTHCHRAFELNAKTILKLFQRIDAYRRPERFQQFLLCCKADALGRTGFEDRRYAQANYLAHALKVALKTKANSFAEQGLKGKEMGEAIEKDRLKNMEAYVKAGKQSLKFYAP